MRARLHGTARALPGAATAMAMALPLALSLAPDNARAGDFSASFGLSPMWEQANDASPYAVPQVRNAPRSLRQDLALRWQEGGLNAQASLRFDAREGRRLDRTGTLNQLYYDGETSEGQGFTIGKKVLSWGVGFGFKPLDLIQREDRRSVNAPALEGVPLLAYDFLTATDAVTLVWQQPGQGRGERASDDQAVALRWYRLAGETDLHAVARVSDRFGLEAGAGFSRTLGDEWSVYGAALYQQRHAVTVNALTGGLATASPLMREQRGAAWKAVAGAQWTGASGLSLLLEAWYDGEAWSAADWRRQHALTAQQRSLAGRVPQAALDGNLAWSASAAFGQVNLMRENLLLQVSQDIEQRWKASADVLYTPRDDGRVFTLKGSYEGDRHRLAIGLRWLGGSRDAATALTPRHRLVWLDWRIALP